MSETYKICNDLHLVKREDGGLTINGFGISKEEAVAMILGRGREMVEEGNRLMKLATMLKEELQND